MQLNHKGGMLHNLATKEAVFTYSSDRMLNESPK